MAALEVPKTQKAAVYDQPGTVSTKIVDIEVPEPGAGEVLINLFVNSSYFVETRLTVL
jgi:Zn-dependent alcohol dehydrogenases